MILLGVKDLAELEEWDQRLDVPRAVFVEPDIGDQKTAMAVMPGTLFPSLKLL